MTTLQLLMGYTKHYYNWKEIIGNDFSKCAYSNCVVEQFDQANLEHADMLFFLNAYFRGQRNFPTVSSALRRKQYWFITTVESAAYFGNRWHSSYDNKFNISATHRLSSVMITPLAMFRPYPKISPSRSLNYAANKTKGAIAYVSNCGSIGYNRLELMKAIGKYIPVDIYGKCGHQPPCRQDDKVCEREFNSQYRFYLSFENSLCDGYSTEKFWGRIAEGSFFVPIAMGGLSVDEYSRLTPLNSFLHVYNFTSLDTLGTYLQQLMTDEKLYNSYHKWRESYEFNFTRRYDHCELCRLANEKPFLPAIPNISAWWNDPKACVSYDYRQHLN